jgi:glycosyltransferase involved in cell wall biosynthesis
MAENAQSAEMKKVILCVPTVKKPYPQTLDSIAASAPVLDAAGWDHGMVSKVGCPYISHARALMLRQALDDKADVIVFIDHDVSWQPNDLLKLIETEGDVVAGTYRFKRDEVEYMGALIANDQGRPIVREDGALLAHSIPAGFLKITKEAVNRFMDAYPELMFGDRYYPLIDLFNHGAHDGVWYGEDYAFARRWREKCGKIWIVPDLDISHHSTEKEYPGNYHQFLLRQPGGSHEGD